MKMFYKLAVCMTLMQFSCTDLLDEKPQKSQVVPIHLSELRALLDNTSQAMNLDPGLLELSADDLVLDPEIFPSLSVQEVNAYLWAEDIYEGENIGEWNTPFRAVLYANAVLDQLPVVSKSAEEKQQWDDLEGSALFYRAYAYWSLAKSFCLAYDTNADQSLGLPIRRDSEITDVIERVSLLETFEFILENLGKAVELLGTRPEFLTRPSREAAFALLAEVYLYMGVYDKCVDAADSSLALKAELMDYNTLDTAAVRPFSMFHEETIFYSSMHTFSYQRFQGERVDPSLYATYEDDDLRKHLYFEEGEGYIEFKGTYTGMADNFSGLSVDQLMLTKAEGLARLGRGSEALELLNELLRSRWKEGRFGGLTASDGKTALDLVLEERRKSLLFRGVRWADLKRLNLDPRYAKDLVRTVGDREYSLPAGSPRFALPIPDEEIIETGMVQNPR